MISGYHYNQTENKIEPEYNTNPNFKTINLNKKNEYYYLFYSSSNSITSHLKSHNFRIFTVINQVLIKFTSLYIKQYSKIYLYLFYNFLFNCAFAILYVLKEPIIRKTYKTLF
jgi:hypothetical protein